MLLNFTVTFQHRAATQNWQNLKLSSREQGPGGKRELSLTAGDALGTSHWPVKAKTKLRCALRKALEVSPSWRSTRACTKSEPHPAAGAATRKPPAASWQCHQVKQALGALNKQRWMREGITDISGFGKRPLEPQLPSRSDWLPPRMLTGTGRATTLALRWARAGLTERNKILLLIPLRLLG